MKPLLFSVVMLVTTQAFGQYGEVKDCLSLGIAFGVGAGTLLAPVELDGVGQLVVEDYISGTAVAEIYMSYRFRGRFGISSGINIYTASNPVIIDSSRYRSSGARYVLPIAVEYEILQSGKISSLVTIGGFLDLTNQLDATEPINGSSIMLPVSSYGMILGYDFRYQASAKSGIYLKMEALADLEKSRMRFGYYSFKLGYITMIF